MAPPEPTTPEESSTTTATATPVATPSPVPPPVPVDTHPIRGAFRPPSRASTDPSRLAPEDAYKNLSPPRLRPLHEITGLSESAAASVAAAAALRPAVASLRAPPAIPPVAARLEQERRRNASRKRRLQPYVWKKLLWIKQRGYPDNYTDTETFLDHLQRNPKFRPYDFWRLVADSTVIVQHVCSVAIFVSAYAGIYQDRLSPVAVVTCGTVATLIGWIMWDHWMGEEEAEAQAALDKLLADTEEGCTPGSLGFTEAANGQSNGHMNGNMNGHANSQSNGNINGNLTGRGLGLKLSTTNLTAKNNEHKLLTSKHAQSLSKSSFNSISPIEPITDTFPLTSPTTTTTTTTTIKFPIRHQPRFPIPHSPTTLPPTISHRNQARLKTAKSALLIYFALLGLSPILKSLTKSTSSDSIWALATWLLIINIFFFDYGSVYTPQTPSQITTAATIKPSTTTSPPTLRSVQPQTHVPLTTNASMAHTSTHMLKIGSAPPFPSSLSTNAALMASTVLASRLPTTTAVFSLSLFSIQAFGLFPVFRRHLRQKSSALHALLTVFLVMTSSIGLGLILARSYTHTYGPCGYYCLGWLWHVIKRSVLGVMVGGTGTLAVMLGSSWWLVNLQRYKNVVIGPWDPAKPVLAGAAGGAGGNGRARGGTD